MTGEMAWNIRRGKFIHQWLKNEFRTTLDWFCTIIEQQITDPVSVELFLTETLPQWPGKSREARAILSEGIQVMSPARLVEVSPLSRCPSDIREQMSHVCHRLWQTRNQHCFDDVEACIDAMDAAYKQIESEVETGKRHEDCIQGFSQLRMTTRELSCAFERLKDAINR